MAIIQNQISSIVQTQIPSKIVALCGKTPNLMQFRFAARKLQYSNPKKQKLNQIKKSIQPQINLRIRNQAPLKNAENLFIIFQQHRRMFIKTNSIFKRQNNPKQKSLQCVQFKTHLRESVKVQSKQLLLNQRLSDFLKIDRVYQPRNKSSSNLQKCSKHYVQIQEKQPAKFRRITKPPSQSKQVKLPLKNNKLIINSNQLNQGQEKNSSNHNTQSSRSNQRFSSFQLKKDGNFSHCQLLQNIAFKNTTIVRNIHNLNHNQNIRPQAKESSFQRRITRKKSSLACQLYKQTKRQRLSIKAKVVNFQLQAYQSQNYSLRMEELQNILQNLQKKQLMLEGNLKSFEKIYREIEIEHKSKKIELQQFEKKLSQVLENLKHKSKDLKQICQRIEEKKQQLSSIQERGEELYNYVNNQQKRKILHQVSQDYKRKQGDMYDYALQMQTNTWATGLKELKPFTEQEKYLQQRISSLCRELSSDQNPMAFEKKCNEIKDFVFKMYASFKRMNDDMRTINDFKTKCIREFVSRMQQWLQNWELKQQFLVNLRQQFAFDQIKLNEDIKSLQDSLIFQGYNQSQEEKLNQIKRGIQKLIENYKLGNSFY